MRLFDLFALMFSSLSVYHSTLHVLPPFVPNDFMYKEHIGKEGDEPWTAFSWATRDLLCTMGGWGKIDQPVREKLAYQAFM